MAKNYEAIHYIRQQLNGFDKLFIDSVVRCFCILDENKEHNGCMSNTAAMFLIARKCGYDPEFCYGICQIENKEFYHAWLEIDGIIIDPSIYGNINFGVGFEDYQTSYPFIGTLEESDILYQKYKFDDDWKEMEKLGVNTLCGFIDGKTLEQYMDGLPGNMMWKLTCRYMDMTPSKELVSELRGYCSGVLFDKYEG